MARRRRRTREKSPEYDNIYGLPLLPRRCPFRTRLTSRIERRTVLAGVREKRQRRAYEREISETDSPEVWPGRETTVTMCRCVITGERRTGGPFGTRTVAADGNERGARS